MAQEKSLIEEALSDAEQVRETALANARAQLEEAFEPRIKSMINKKLQTELDESEELEEETLEEDEGDVADDEGELEDPTHADTATMEEADDEEMDDEEEDDEGDEDEEEEEMEEDVDLDLESVIAELESELDEASSEYGNPEGDEDGDGIPDSEDDDDEEDMNEEIIDLDELLDTIAEENGDDDEEGDDEEEESSEDEEDDEMEESIDLEELFDSLEEGEDTNEDLVGTLKTENKKLTSENAEYRKAVEILRSKLNEVNLLNAKLLYTSKLFKKYNLNNSQKMKVVESFDRTKSVRETKLVFSTLAESFQMNGGSKGSKTKRTKSITEGLASSPVKSTKPNNNSEIISENTDETVNRFKKLVNYNKKK